MTKQKRYDLEYKIQAIKLAKEIGVNKAAKELGIAPSTLSTWNQLAKQGIINPGPGEQTPQSALSIVDELNSLRKQNKELSKEIKRIKEENEFLAEASAFFAASRRK